MGHWSEVNWTPQTALENVTDLDVIIIPHVLIVRAELIYDGYIWMSEMDKGSEADIFIWSGIFKHNWNARYIGVKR